MTFNIKVKGKDQEVKFNYGLNFKANKKLGSKNAQGESQNDGAGILFIQTMEKEDDALINLIQLVCPKATETEAVEAIESYMKELVDGGLSEEEAYDKIFDDLKEEMLTSGFFVNKIKKYMKNLDKAVNLLNSKEDEESKIQKLEIEDLLGRMKKEIS